MKKITLNFEGYWAGVSKGMLENSGIYCVYRAVVNLGEKKVSLKKLIYIGEAKNVKERIRQHISDEDWVDCLKNGECFCYSNAYVSSQDRERVEAALIYYYKPQCNNQHRYDYGDYAGTAIETRGKNEYIGDAFIVE